MAIPLGRWRNPDRDKARMKFEKSRGLALSVGTGVAGAGLDRARQALGQQEGMLQRQFGREEEQARLSDIRRESTRKTKLAKPYEPPIKAVVRTPGLPTAFLARRKARLDFLQEQGIPFDPDDPQLLRALMYAPDEEVAKAASSRDLTSLTGGMPVWGPGRPTGAGSFLRRALTPEEALPGTGPLGGIGLAEAASIIAPAGMGVGLGGAIARRGAVQAARSAAVQPALREALIPAGPSIPQALAKGAGVTLGGEAGARGLPALATEAGAPPEAAIPLSLAGALAGGAGGYGAGSLGAQATEAAIQRAGRNLQRQVDMAGGWDNWLREVAGVESFRNLRGRGERGGTLFGEPEELELPPEVRETAFGPTEPVYGLRELGPGGRPIYSEYSRWSDEQLEAFADSLTREFVGGNTRAKVELDEINSEIATRRAQSSLNAELDAEVRHRIEGLPGRAPRDLINVDNATLQVMAWAGDPDAADELARRGVQGYGFREPGPEEQAGAEELAFGPKPSAVSPEEQAVRQKDYKEVSALRKRQNALEAEHKALVKKMQTYYDKNRLPPRKLFQRQDELETAIHDLDAQIAPYSQRTWERVQGRSREYTPEEARGLSPLEQMDAADLTEAIFRTQQRLSRTPRGPDITPEEQRFTEILQGDLDRYTAEWHRRGYRGGPGTTGTVPPQEPTDPLGQLERTWHRLGQQIQRLYENPTPANKARAEQLRQIRDQVEQAARRHQRGFSGERGGTGRNLEAPFDDRMAQLERAARGEPEPGEPTLEQSLQASIDAAIRRAGPSPDVQGIVHQVLGPHRLAQMSDEELAGVIRMAQARLGNLPPMAGGAGQPPPAGFPHPASAGGGKGGGRKPPVAKQPLPPDEPVRRLENIAKTGQTWDEAGGTVDEYNNLLDRIHRAFKVDDPIKGQTHKAMLKLMAGVRIGSSEQRQLSKIFGRNIGKNLQRRKTLPRKSYELGLNIANVPRAVQASWDFSMPLRQGVFMSLTRPTQSIPAFRRMMQAFFFEGTEDLVRQQIDASPWAWARKKELYLAKRDDPITKAEENLVGGMLAEKIPLIGWGVKRSQRAARTYLNKLRADVFDTVAAQWAKEEAAMTAKRAAGKSPSLVDRIWQRTALHTQTDYDHLARHINYATGRGGLGKFEGAGPFLNATLFSPRLLTSRVQMPLNLLFASSPVRKEILRDVIGTMVPGLTFLYLMKQSGAADVNLDPRSPDFAKIKIGDHRIDFWGGYQQIVRYVAQAATGYITNDYDPDAVMFRFLRSKMSPALGLGTDIATQETFLGDEFKPTTGDEKFWADQVRSRLVPLFINDMYEAIEQEGLTGAGLALPAAFGVSSQTYPERKSSQLFDIPRYRGLPPDVQRQIMGRNQEGDPNYEPGFIDEVNKIRDDAVTTGRATMQQVADTPWEYTARQHAQATGKDEKFLQWAIRLRKNPDDPDLLNPDWLDFVLRNEQELRRESPLLFDRWLDEFLNRNRGRVAGQ